MRTHVFFLGIVLCAAPDARADQLIGLLTLPEVFGREACDKFQPQEVALYAAPFADERIGWIRVDKDTEFHAAGGCTGPEVKVHRVGGGGVSDFPAMEYAYEKPAAVVLERRDRWFKVRLRDGSGWLRASERDEFHSLEALLTDGLLHLTDNFDGNLREGPGSTRSAGTTRLEIDALAPPPVRTIEFRHVDGQLWVHVEVLSHSICGSCEPATVIRRGWLPAHDNAGEPTIWFYSRGC